MLGSNLADLKTAASQDVGLGGHAALSVSEQLQNNGSMSKMSGQRSDWRERLFANLHEWNKN
jgi:hypothetical protein